MFGYIRVHQKELKIREFDTYRSYYCGLCHTLKKQYGRKGQLLLNYDCTFLVMLLSGLYEPEEVLEKRRCIAHPVGRHEEILTEADTYAADMTVLLYYQKAMDDWRDNHSIPKRALADSLRSSYKKARKAWPRQARALESALKKLDEAEKAQVTDIDYVSGLNGAFLAEMFVMKEDFWQEDLRELGMYLGKFIYLMDAYDDLEKDQKNKDYNPWIPMQQTDPEGFETAAKEIMVDIIGRAARAFERLPIVKNVEILRNILYAGVWERYAEVQKERQLEKSI